MDLKYLLISLILFYFNVYCVAQCHIDDWTALKALYESTNGDEWQENEGWEQIKNDSPPENCDLSKLKGVTLDEDYNARVERLSLPNNNLVGQLPEEIGKLTKIKNFSIPFNQVSGEIPATIGQLEILERVNLDFNNLNGEIPIEFLNLNNVSTIQLQYNLLSGEIPAGIVYLQNIFKIYLNNNQLIGQIPEYNNPNKSIFLFLHNNQLTGIIPSVFGNVRFNAQKLTLFNNNLGGCFDKNLNKMCDSFKDGVYGFQDSITEGNDFDATWSEFCFEGKGICDTTNVGQPNSSPPLVGTFNCE